MKLPKLCRHKGRGLGYVTWLGKEIYFGAWPEGKVAPKAVREAYGAFVAKLIGGEVPDTRKKGETTVSELCSMFVDWAASELGADERRNYSAILTPVVGLFGDTAASDFGPVKLRRIQQWFIENPIEARRKVDGKIRTVRIPRTRTGINISINRIRRIWRWGVSRELVKAETLVALQTLEGLELGRAKAPEAKPRVAVDDKLVGDTVKLLHPIIATMVRLQRLTGMRPGEVCSMTMGQIEQGAAGWLYCPAAHKNRHRGKPRNIPLSPAAVELIRPFVATDPNQHLFRPCDLVDQMNQERRAARKTPITPSHRMRGAENPKRRPGQAYTSHSYCRAIAKICKRHGLEQWSPNQLRKSAINEVAQKAGERHARAFAGHADADVTRRFYLEQDIALAQEAASMIKGN